jgi:phage baseplate assembly protein gpV
MSDLIDVIRRVVQQELARQRGSLLGVVTAIFPHEDKDDDNNYEVDVRLKHEDLELRKVPVAVGHIGIAAPPRVGDLVIVQFVNGDLNQPLILGRFYHADDRPPLHHEDEILFEQRVAADGTLNQLRFTNDGTIFLQRDVTKPEDNSEAKASVKIDPAGNVEIKAGTKTVISLANDGEIKITADSQPIDVKCDKMTIDAQSGLDVKGDLKVIGSAGSTTISGHEITGA